MGVFKSFKTFFSKVCRQYMAKNPGRVVTEDILATLVGDAFTQLHTPLNILGGFKKAGIYPFNPGEVSDRQLAPSKALTKPTPQVPTFSPEQIARFEVQYAEGYDVQDTTYLAWKSIYHPSPESVSSAATTVSSSPGSSASACAMTSTAYAATSTSASITSSVSVSASVITTPSLKSLPSSEEVLNELLVLPQSLPAKTGRRKKAINDKAKEITDAAVLQEMKEKKQADADAKKMKEEKKLERERKARERQEEKERKKLEREERQKEKERKAKEKSKKTKKQRRATKHAPSPVDTVRLESLFTQLDVEDNGQCSSCGMVFSQEDDEDRFWVCCDRCDKWYCFACHKLPTKDSVPDEFYCMKCT